MTWTCRLFETGKERLIRWKRKKEREGEYFPSVIYQRNIETAASTLEVLAHSPIYILSFVFQTFIFKFLFRQILNLNIFC